VCVSLSFIPSFIVICFSVLQLKGSDLELTIVKRSSAPRVSLNGPACTFVNLRVKVNNKEQGMTCGGPLKSLFFNQKKKTCYMDVKLIQLSKEVSFRLFFILEKTEHLSTSMYICIVNVKDKLS